mmetsp:Transcript_6850/g.24359  ORF Transcript_6850/g.24359 Transcript_6850/m.24359 type:complete len:242 (+) Transcript_6850:4175-4900(+)
MVVRARAHQLAACRARGLPAGRVPVPDDEPRHRAHVPVHARRGRVVAGGRHAAAVLHTRVVRLRRVRRHHGRALLDRPARHHRSIPVEAPRRAAEARQRRRHRLPVGQVRAARVPVGDGGAGAQVGARLRRHLPAVVVGAAGDGRHPHLCVCVGGARALAAVRDPRRQRQNRQVVLGAAAPEPRHDAGRVCQRPPGQDDGGRVGPREWRARHEHRGHVVARDALVPHVPRLLDLRVRPRPA